MLKLTSWFRGTNPPTLQQKRSQAHQNSEPKYAGTELAVSFGEAEGGITVLSQKSRPGVFNTQGGLNRGSHQRGGREVRRGVLPVVSLPVELPDQRRCAQESPVRQLSDPRSCTLFP